MATFSSPSGRATTRALLRTSLLFLLVWLPGTSLDVFTTEVARQQGDWVELNPTGFVPLQSAVVREVKLTLLGASVVLMGAYFLRDALIHAGTVSLDQFGEALFSRNAWAVPLLGVPFFCAIGRYGVVLSNACLLSVGWNPMDTIILLPLQALFRDDALGYIVSIAIGVIVLWYPVTSLIVRLLYAANRSTKAQAS